MASDNAQHLREKVIPDYTARSATPIEQQQLNEAGEIRAVIATPRNSDSVDV